MKVTHLGGKIGEKKGKVYTQKLKLLINLPPRLLLTFGVCLLVFFRHVYVFVYTEYFFFNYVTAVALGPNSRCSCSVVCLLNLACKQSQTTQASFWLLC